MSNARWSRWTPITIRKDWPSASHSMSLWGTPGITPSGYTDWEGNDCDPNAAMALKIVAATVIQGANLPPRPVRARIPQTTAAISGAATTIQRGKEQLSLQGRNLFDVYGAKIAIDIQD